MPRLARDQRAADRITITDCDSPMCTEPTLSARQPYARCSTSSSANTCEPMSPKIGLRSVSSTELLRHFDREVRFQSLKAVPMPEAGEMILNKVPIVAREQQHGEGHWIERSIESGVVDPSTRANFP